MSELEQARAVYIQVDIDLSLAKVKYDLAKVKNSSTWGTIKNIWVYDHFTWHEYTQLRYNHKMARDKLIRLEIKHILATRKSI